MKQQLTPILLPTDKESSLFKDKHNKLWFGGQPQIDDLTNQHLYLIDDSEIKEGNYYYNQHLKQIGQCNGNITPEMCKVFGYKLVIATSDKNLTGIAQIPQDFIKYFVEKQGNVEKVMVEYESKWISNILQGQTDVLEHKPKLTKDNEVIIFLEEKSYTRDEMIAFGQKCGTAGTMAERIGEDFNHLFLQLVKQNL